MPKRLRNSDEVLKCVRALRRALKLLDSESLLVNGKIEMQLKVFIGAAWERGDPAGRAFVMDKGFKRPKKRSSKANDKPGKPLHASKKGKMVGGLDLVAFQGKTPEFWIETKCSFFEHPEDGARSARSALRQVTATSGRLRDEFNTCPTYIVHFVNSTPKEPSASRPDYVLKKYPKPELPENLTPKQWRESELTTIESIYSRKRGTPNYVSSARVNLHSSPSVHAIVVKLRN